MDTLTSREIDTPLGPMIGVADWTGLHLFEFAERRALTREYARLERRLGPASPGTTPILDALVVQLDAYFAGRRTTFDVPLVEHGSAFQRGVWSALRAIPCGETRSYSAIAREVGRPDAVRAVAQANGANQIAVLIPCHRVIGADGSLTGYGGRLWRKEWLLEHERRITGRAAPARQAQLAL
jgi:AraC family transcriptional regulator of adaptative response/methylated-DNA-[protein]-cysteine methyltransferase